MPETRGLKPRAHLALARTRVVVAGALGFLVFKAVSAVGPWEVAALTGWDTAAGVFVGWVIWVAYGKDGAATAMLATREDDSRTAADVLLVAACVASLAGVGAGLVKASHERGTTEGALTALAVVSVVLSWAAVHAVFMLRYARLYYTDGGGIDFNDDHSPDYHDFAYVALTIGMTYQVSDTDVTTKSIRRTATRHPLLSYVFGPFVVAITIKFVAGLLM